MWTPVLRSTTFPCTREGGSTQAPTARMLKSAAWGAGGPVARRKLLKAQGGLAFFKLQKNRALNGPERHSTSAPGCFASAPCCNQSAFSSSSQTLALPLGLPWRYAGSRVPGESSIPRGSAKSAHLSYFLRVDARHVCLWASANLRAIASSLSCIALRSARSASEGMRTLAIWIAGS